LESVAEPIKAERTGNEAARGDGAGSPKSVHYLKESLKMNAKQLIALLLLSASAGAVLADTDTPLNPPAGFTRTRAEVVAELQQSPSWIANGDASYPMLPAAQSGKSRHQVQAELAASQVDVHDNSLYSGS
jgi:hypothetical protein